MSSSFLFSVPPACLLDPSLGTHEYVTANGIKFHYVAAGDRSKPLMLFLHGFPEVSNDLTELNLCAFKSDVLFTVLVLMATSDERIQ